MRLIVSALLGALLLAAQIPRDKAWQILKEGAADKSHETRAKAIQALGLIVKNTGAREMAEKALADEKYEVRENAARALGGIKLAASIPKLKEALKDSDIGVVLAATNALLELGDPIAFDIFYAVLTGEKKSGESLKDSQMKMLSDPKAMAKMGFAAGVGFIPFGGAGLTVFKMATKDDSSPIRAAAAQKLVRDPDPKAANAMVKTVSDKKWLVRAAVIDALARRDEAAHLPAILPALADENEMVKFTAAAAVIRLSK